MGGTQGPGPNLQYGCQPKKMGVYPPKASILIGFSIINHPFWGPTPIFGNIHMFFSVSSSESAEKKIWAQSGLYLSLWWTMSKLWRCTRDFHVLWRGRNGKPILEHDHFHCFSPESISCPCFHIFSKKTILESISFRNWNHIMTLKTTPLPLILHNVSLSYLYLTPHNPVHPVRKQTLYGKTW